LRRRPHAVATRVRLLDTEIEGQRGHAHRPDRPGAVVEGRRGDAADVALVLLVVDREPPPADPLELALDRGNGGQRVGRAPLRPPAGEDAADVGGGQLGQDRLADRRAVERHAPADSRRRLVGALRVLELLHVDRLVAAQQRQVDRPSSACNSRSIGPK
jgi:hypothetical protein